jgi:hypothetical protein
MRILLTLICVLAFSGPALADDDVPLVPIGLPFAPEAPTPVSPAHPLYHRIILAPVTDMPATIGASSTLGLMAAAKRSSFEKGLRDTLDRLNMLATFEAEAKFRLTPKWLGMDAPFRISFTSRAKVRMGWSLTRTDSGQEIFQRDIATSAESKGGDGSRRAIGVGRVALMANIASAARCLDKAAYGQAPQDCTLTPQFKYDAPRPQMYMFHYGR